VRYIIHMCDMTHSYVWHDSFICVTWLIHMCDMTHSYVWHASFISVWHDLYDMTHSHVRCPIKCMLCERKCGSVDHFHDSLPGALHMCAGALSRTLSLTHSLSISLSFYLSLFLLLSFSHSRARTHARSRALFLSHTHTLCLSLVHIAHPGALQMCIGLFCRISSLL